MLLRQVESPPYALDRGSGRDTQIQIDARELVGLGRSRSRNRSWSHNRNRSHSRLVGLGHTITVMYLREFDPPPPLGPAPYYFRAGLLPNIFRSHCMELVWRFHFQLDLVLS